MGVYVERWLNEYTNDPPSCAKVYSDVAEYVSAKERIDVERVRVMYFYGQMPNYREGPVPLKDLPNSDELAINYITWRGDYKSKHYCFWWADSMCTDDGVYLGKHY